MRLVPGKARARLGETPILPNIRYRFPKASGLWWGEVRRGAKPLSGPNLRAYGAAPLQYASPRRRGPYRRMFEFRHQPTKLLQRHARRAAACRYRDFIDRTAN